jgi:hypothetical protein
MKSGKEVWQRGQIEGPEEERGGAWRTADVAIRAQCRLDWGDRARCYRLVGA